VSSTPPDKPDTTAAPPPDEQERRAKQSYEQGIIERGEAAVADAEGRLPPGATHEITGHDEAGRPILKRRRFSAF